MFRPHFTSGNGLFGKNNNRGTYIDQRGCSLAATHLGCMINGPCRNQLAERNIRMIFGDGFRCKWKEKRQEKERLIRLDLPVCFFTRQCAKVETNDTSNVVSILNY